MSTPNEDYLDGALAELKKAVAKMLASLDPDKVKPAGQEPADQPSAGTPERADNPVNEVPHATDGPRHQG